jgi:hypothetical protein
MVGLSHKPGLLSIHFEKCRQKMARGGWNNHLDGMSVRHWEIPFISAGIWRNTAVFSSHTAPVATSVSDCRFRLIPAEIPRKIVEFRQIPAKNPTCRPRSRQLRQVPVRRHRKFRLRHTGLRRGEIKQLFMVILLPNASKIGLLMA